MYLLTNLFCFVEEDYLSRTNYVKIAPKITPMLKTHQSMYAKVREILI